MIVLPILKECPYSDRGAHSQLFTEEEKNHLSVIFFLLELRRLSEGAIEQILAICCIIHRGFISKNSNACIFEAYEKKG